MKKILLLMAIALPFVFISCDDNEPVVPDDHEWVDLGLPSGTLWATCNVGANSPEEYGDYFAWGETTPKERYDGSNYKWARWDWDTISGEIPQVNVTFNKYYFRDWDDNAYVEGDRKTELDPEDDAAYVNWGSQWRMPTLEQLLELEEYCDCQWTERNGITGQLITGPNGKTIFFPAAGARADRTYYIGENSYYWSRTLCSPEKYRIEVADQEDAYILFLDPWYKEVWYSTRYEGHSIRPARASKK